MTNHARNGAARERKVRDDLIAHGWLLVARSAGSKGAADLVMVHPDHGLALIQVGTDNKDLGPAKRDRLLHLAYLCGALPIVAHCWHGIRYWRVVDGPASQWEGWSP